MKKLYCDRCGAECERLHSKRVPNKIWKHGSYEAKEIELCKSCEEFVSVAEDAYNEAMVKVRFAFFESLMSDVYKKEYNNDR